VYVLDTSVLLSDPRSVQRFEEHSVVLPLVVLTELEGKRNHPELGWAARQSLRIIEDLRIAHGSLTTAIPVNDTGGTLRVEVNHQDRSLLPDAFAQDSNDHRILAVAVNLAAEGNNVVVVSKDLPLRLKASVLGLAAEEYRNELAVDTGWTGMVEIDVDGRTIDELFDLRVIDLLEARDLPCHTGVVLVSGSQSALGRVHPDKRVHLIRSDRELFGLRGRSAEQKVALDLLADHDIGKP
jgi:PhoH-like ATPase